MHRKIQQAKRETDQEAGRDGEKRGRERVTIAKDREVGRETYMDR